MAKKFLTPINVTNLSSDPVSANEGDIYYNTASDVLRVYANGSWSNVSSGGATGVTSVTGTANEVDVSASTGAVTISLPATINANTTGTAASLTTARAIALSGDVSGSANFDGSASAGITTTLANTAVTPATYGSASAVGTITVDSKGRVTGASNTAIAIDQSAVTNLTSDLSGKVNDIGDTITGELVISANTSGNALRVTQTGAGNALVVEDSANPDSSPFVINTNGQVLIGDDTARTVGGVSNQGLQVSGGGGGRINTVRYDNNANSGGIFIAKSRSSTPGSFTTVQSGDGCGLVSWYGDDGSSLANNVARIEAAVDGSVSTNAVPGRLMFSTNAANGNAATERMRIDSAGNVTFGTTSAQATLKVFQNTAGNYLLGWSRTDNSGVGGITYGDTNGAIAFHTSTTGVGTERMRITSAGNVGIGTSSPDSRLVVFDATTSRVQIQGNATTDLWMRRASTDASGNRIFLDKARGTIASPSIVADADYLGEIRWRGHDGTDWRNAAIIQAEVDGTPGSGDMPGRLTFWTTPDGTTTITERMRINSAGNVGIGKTPAAGILLDVNGKGAFSDILTAPTASVDTNTTQVATTAYVVGQGYLKSGTASSTYAPLASPTFTGTVTVPTPVNATDAVTKIYVDNIAQGLHVHAPCAAATPNTLASLTSGTVTYNNGTNGVGATLTLQNALTTLDGRSLQNGDRILVKNEATAANNGIYTWATGGTVLTRATDYDTPTEMAGGDFTFVQNGTLYNDTGWVMTDPVTTVGTTAVNFVQFSGAGTYTAGTGLALNGTVFSNTGVLSLAGTTNEITVSASTGSITLSIPAAIARLASPTFTGTPAAPTAAVDTNTTQIATTAYVVGQGYLKSATASSTYAPLASPTFTGTVTAATLDLTTAATATTATSYFVETGSDGVVRPKTLANVRTEIVTTAAVNSAAATTVGTVTSGTWQGSSISTTYTDAKVTSVNGSTGAITGLAVDNTVVHLAGTETITGAKSFSNAIKVDSATAAAQALQFWNAASFFGSIGTDQSLRGSGTSTDLALRSDTGRAIRFMTNGANERMVIDSAGNVAIGLTSTSVKLNVSGTTWLDQASGDTVVRAQGLTVGFTPASNYTLNSDPGDSLRNTALISKGATRPVVLTLRNADNASSFWDIIADGNTNKFFIRRTNGTGTALTVDVNQNVGINTTSPAFKLEVNGSFAATTKSFVIDHPTKPDMKLRYGSLEGPENGVYVRGKTKSSIITLPDYWTGLIDEDSITVQITPIGNHKNLYVKEISNNAVKVGGARGKFEFFYFIQAERKDVEKLVVEY